MPEQSAVGSGHRHPVRSARSAGREPKQARAEGRRLPRHRRKGRAAGHRLAVFTLSAGVLCLYIFPVKRRHRRRLANRPAGVAPDTCGDSSKTFPSSWQSRIVMEQVPPSPPPRPRWVPLQTSACTQHKPAWWGKARCTYLEIRDDVLPEAPAAPGSSPANPLNSTCSLDTDTPGRRATARDWSRPRGPKVPKGTTTTVFKNKPTAAERERDAPTGPEYLSPPLGPSAARKLRRPISAGNTGYRTCGTGRTAIHSKQHTRVSRPAHPVRVSARSVAWQCGGGAGGSNPGAGAPVTSPRCSNARLLLAGSCSAYARASLWLGAAQRGRAARGARRSGVGTALATGKATATGGAQWRGAAAAGRGGA